MKRGELDDLVAFAAIARTRSFTRAAAELNLSPSALSHAMKALETRLGVQLLARTTRSVSPTPAGERLLSSLEPALNEVENGLAAMGNWRGTPSGTIRLTTFFYAAHTILARALPKFLIDYPDVAVEVVVESRLSDLVKDGFDAGIRFGYAVDQDMLAVAVGPPARTVIVGSLGYFQRQSQPQVPADLDHHNCINYRQDGGGGLITWDFEHEGKEIRVRPGGQLVVNDAYLALAAILAGAGLGFMLEDHAAPYISSGQLIQVLEDWSAPFPGLHMYYPNRQVTPALRALIEALRWKG